MRPDVYLRMSTISSSFVTSSIETQRKPNSRKPCLSQPRRLRITSTPGSPRTRTTNVGRAKTSTHCFACRVGDQYPNNLLLLKVRDCMYSLLNSGADGWIVLFDKLIDS